MSIISIKNLSFTYDGSFSPVFDNVSFELDSNWKLGFSGRNGRGKTTLLNLLSNKLEYTGSIQSNIDFAYFPYSVENEYGTVIEVAQTIFPRILNWMLNKELSLLGLDQTILYQPYYSLSSGEKTKVLLAILFLQENCFLLIDEPTNHLDQEARQLVSSYLKNKHSFILVSHDRHFLDECVDHMLVINRSNIEVQRGNFSTWWTNKENQDKHELSLNTTIKKDIKRLELSARNTTEWSNKVEASKNVKVGGLKPDKGYVGHKSAKMMQRAKNIEKRIDNSLVEKRNLLKNIEEIEHLKINQIDFFSDTLVIVDNISLIYNDNIVFKNISFTLNKHDRLCLKGCNGSGKSSIIKAILKQDIPYTGTIHTNPNLLISYVSQDTSELEGSLQSFIYKHAIDETLFKAILRKLDFSREQFSLNIDCYSQGQKKKLLIAKSLTEKAHLYIFDEPLNYIDVYSRIQIEKLLLNSNASIIFVEHDQIFQEAVSTKYLYL